MGDNSSSKHDYKVKIHTKASKIIKMLYSDLVDHILLLRKVISQPDLTVEGPILKAAIDNYCFRMSNHKMSTKSQQAQLPWQVDWIWHVHRLHPINYANDCIQSKLPGEVVDKKSKRISLVDYSQNDVIPNASSRHVEENSCFIPSIDLMKAVVRQRDFLDKFKQHPLASCDLTAVKQGYFKNMVQNYVSFIKLAEQKSSLIVPTFDIDIIWHTHMRYPKKYSNDMKILCGFVLNHDDSIQKGVLNTAYQSTAEQWKEIYKSTYGENVDQNHLRKNQNVSLCDIAVGFDLRSDTE